MKRQLARKAVLVGLALAVASTTSFVACSQNPGGASVGSPGPEATGTVGVQLTLPGGETIERIAYTMSGPTTYSGTEDVAGAGTTFRFVIPNVAPGDGYTLTLTATTVTGAVTCTGASSAFSVAVDQTTSVRVLLACTTTSEAGTVLVDGTGFNCASWRAAVASPATTTTGGTVALLGAAVGPDPGAIAYEWTAPAGTLADATKSSATFTCPATPGDVTITLTVGDGPVPQGATCPSASSVTTLTVTCNAPAGAAGAWLFDEGSGTTAFDSVGTSNATITNGTWQSGASCHSGSCLSFDLTSSPAPSVTASVAAFRFGAGDFTVSAWAKIAPTAQHESVIVGAARCAVMESWLLSVVSHKAAFGTWGTSSTGGYFLSPNSVDDGAWHLITGVRSAGMLYLYVDGAQVASQALGAASYVSDTAGSLLTIGNLSGCGWGGFGGSIDSVRIFGRALTAAEIASL